MFVEVEECYVWLFFLRLVVDDVLWMEDVVVVRWCGGGCWVLFIEINVVIIFWWVLNMDIGLCVGLWVFEIVVVLGSSGII